MREGKKGAAGEEEDDGGAYIRGRGGGKRTERKEEDDKNAHIQACTTVAADGEAHDWEEAAPRPATSASASTCSPAGRKREKGNSWPPPLLSLLHSDPSLHF